MISTDVWKLPAVVNIWLCLVGIVVFLSISLLDIPPTVSIERDNIKISQKDYEIINTLGVQMEMDSNLWSSLKNNIIK